MLKHRAAIQGNSKWVGEWYSENRTEFNKNKSKNLYLGQMNPSKWHRLGINCLGSRTVGKALGFLGAVSWTLARSVPQKQKQPMASCTAWAGTELEWLFPLLNTHWSTPAYCIQLTAHSTRKTSGNWRLLSRNHHCGGSWSICAVRRWIWKYLTAAAVSARSSHRGQSWAHDVGER